MGTCCTNNTQDKDAFTAITAPIYINNENLEVGIQTKIKESNETPSSPIRSEKIDVWFSIKIQHRMRTMEALRVIEE
ncbi:unnamed protein product [Paramecium octaurelia]|uniref:Uncharacterized protein n=1 Tax=Paramecium octaurelia TaxID=43137 RepID=A0A8S1SRL7_PAROT|nr:unnamed protein product [Paramecium octaurelia]